MKKTLAEFFRNELGMNVEISVYDTDGGIAICRRGGNVVTTDLTVLEARSLYLLLGRFVDPEGSFTI